MKNLFKILCAGLIAFFLATAVESAYAGSPKYIFKVASLAPEGSVWAKRFRDFTKEVTEKSNGEIGFKIYAGGVMGDDRAMYRKMRVGQLNGGGFTMTGISEVVPDFRVLGIPFLFNSYDEVDRVREKLMPRFEKEFDDKGLVLLAVSEVGFVYTMSTTPITTLAELKQSKAWAPEGDPISQVLLETVGVTPIPAFNSGRAYLAADRPHQYSFQFILRLHRPAVVHPDFLYNGYPFCLCLRGIYS